MKKNTPVHGRYGSGGAKEGSEAAKTHCETGGSNFTTASQASAITCLLPRLAVDREFYYNEEDIPAVVDQTGECEGGTEPICNA